MMTTMELWMSMTTMTSQIWILWMMSTMMMNQIWLKTGVKREIPGKNHGVHINTAVMVIAVMEGIVMVVIAKGDIAAITTNMADDTTRVVIGMDDAMVKNILTTRSGNVNVAGMDQTLITAIVLNKLV